MPLSTKQIIINPLNLWLSGRDYFVGNTVENSAVSYRCILDHTSSGANQPPNATFWQLLDDPIPNTIKLVAKKIVRGIDKREGGQGGGFIRTITGVRRFTSGEE